MKLLCSGVVVFQWSRKQSHVAGATGTETSCGCGFDYCDHNYSFVEVVIKF